MSEIKRSVALREARWHRLPGDRRGGPPLQAARQPVRRTGALDRPDPETPDSDLHRILRRFEIDASRLSKDITASLDRLPRGATSISDLSPHICGHRGARVGVLDAPVRRLLHPHGAPVRGGARRGRPSATCCTRSRGSSRRSRPRRSRDDFAQIVSGSPEGSQGARTDRRSPPGRLATRAARRRRPRSAGRRRSRSSRPTSPSAPGRGRSTRSAAATRRSARSSTS